MKILFRLWRYICLRAPRRRRLSYINNDYKLAEGAGTVYVRITPKSVTVIWGADKLVYNGEFPVTVVGIR